VRKVAENRGVLRQEYLLEYFMVRKWGVFIRVFCGQGLGSIYWSIFVVMVVTICNNIVIICNYKETRENRVFRGYKVLQYITESVTV
jgi:hypothetical protein